MNLYLLERTDTDIGYDEYVGFVIAANDAKEARKIACTNWGSWSCKKVGETFYKKPRTILDSFNAG